MHGISTYQTHQSNSHPKPKRRMSESDRTSFCCEGGMAPPRSGRSKLRGQMPKAYANEATATGRVLEHERPAPSLASVQDAKDQGTLPRRLIETLSGTGTTRTLRSLGLCTCHIECCPRANKFLDDRKVHILQCEYNPISWIEGLEQFIC